MESRRLVAARFPDGKIKLARVGEQPDGLIVRPLTMGEQDECDYKAVPHVPKTVE